jgi:hypothetical protein
VKFLCLECDEVMGFQERRLPGDGTLAAVFACGSCGREMAMLANPMETQLVSSMGVKIGGTELPAQPMEVLRSSLEGGRDDAFVEADDVESGAPKGTAPEDARPPRPAPVEWSPEAVDRLGRVPGFVRGMVKRIYTDYARERGIRTITPQVMDTARSELGLEGM